MTVALKFAKKNLTYHAQMPGFKTMNDADDFFVETKAFIRNLGNKQKFNDKFSQNLIQHEKREVKIQELPEEDKLVFLKDFEENGFKIE